ncbi:aminotransferase class III-fold pyridoxal phosphate-dependent enzyme [Micromonospora sp. KC606]|uniref:aminotransferase class III-fold pyridoxal phosphate-dependent enzyme n=1 Tax=Micromonospora sp. KC606 TaxID=2530379 RepID=UPI00104994D8|nr:aminotransferase class III-fold pyridoxal phosphate-dependent enzyme [Micromonospora sp. KC606]TDC84982.1 aminotransferase class III-fold pyridoxal phosphate-dependent enzyme [Micromonospora sp. KC606]
MVSDPVFHPWAAQAKVVQETVAGGSGAWFWNHDGERWLDLHSQLGNLHLGHQHPAVVAAVTEQAARLCTLAPSFRADVRDEAARRILDVAPAGGRSVLFTTGGAEAVEHALRMARVTTGRPKILAAHRSYHGATDGAMGVTGDPRRWPLPATGAGTVRFSGPYRYRSDFHATTEVEERDRALEHLYRLVAYEGPESIAAIIIEPVAGSNGVLVPPDGYLAGVRALCDEHGILLIADEVMTGFGRCGAWFATDLWQVRPDLMTFAKGVNSGYVPVGGVVVGERVAEHFAERPYPGGLTYSGHPLACASIVASIGVLRDEGLVSRAAQLGETVVRPLLQDLAARLPVVGEVRGTGLAWAIELVADRATREPLVPYAAPGRLHPRMAEILRACRLRGVWPFVAANRIHLFPPLVITEDDLRAGLTEVGAVLAG